MASLGTNDEWRLNESTRVKSAMNAAKLLSALGNDQEERKCGKYADTL